MTTSHRTLGLRRHLGGPGPEMLYSPDTTYGLTRGQPRQRTQPASPVVDEPAPEPVVEHIQAPAETDAVIEGVETAAHVAAKPAFVNPHPGYWEWNDGELIPDVGPYTSREGYRWIDGLPAFLVEDRPVSNIR